MRRGKSREIVSSQGGYTMTSTMLEDANQGWLQECETLYGMSRGTRPAQPPHLDVEVHMGERVQELAEGGLEEIIVVLVRDILGVANPDWLVLILQPPVPFLLVDGLHDRLNL